MIIYKYQNVSKSIFRLKNLAISVKDSQPKRFLIACFKLDTTSSISKKRLKWNGLTSPLLWKAQYRSHLAGTYLKKCYFSAAATLNMATTTCCQISGKARSSNISFLYPLQLMALSCLEVIVATTMKSISSASKFAFANNLWCNNCCLDHCRLSFEMWRRRIPVRTTDPFITCIHDLS